MRDFCFTVSEQDYLDFNLYHARRAPESRRRRWTMRLIPPMIFIAIMLLKLPEMRENGTLAAVGLTYLVLEVLFEVFLPVLQKNNIKKGIRLVKRQGRLPYGRTVELSFRDDLLVSVNERDAMKMRYSKIKRVVVWKTAVYIYTETNRAILIPNWVFPGEEAKQELVRFLNQKIDIAQGRIPPGGM